MPTPDVREFSFPHHADVVRREAIDAFVEIVHLEDRHVAAGPIALVEQPLHRGPLLRRREHFDELVAHEQQRVAQPELADDRVVEAHLQTERLSQFVDHRIEIRCDHRDLPDTDHDSTCRKSMMTGNAARSWIMKMWPPSKTCNVASGRRSTISSEFSIGAMSS